MASLSVDPKNLSGAAPAETPGPQENLLSRLVREHFRFIVAVIALLVAVVILYAISRYFHQQNIISGQAELHSIVAEKSGQDKVEHLEALLKHVPEEIRPAVAFELVRAGLELGDPKAVEKGWTAVASSSSGLDISKEVDAVAAMGKVSALMSENDLPGALVVLKTMRQSAPETFQPFVLSRLAVVYELAGDNNGAIVAYKDMKALDPVNAGLYDQRIADLQGSNATGSAGN